MVAADGEQVVADEATPALRHPDDVRLALVVFVVVEAGAAVMYAILGRRQWFYADDWVFLAGRRLGDVLLPYGGHWTALPLIAYRTLYALVGLRSYAPYLAMTIALQVTNAALLRVVLRRSGVSPWIATAAASLFALFGAGAQDILFAFQIAFAGALMFGFVQLLLADHDGPIRLRDGIGLLAGLAALLCSDVGLAMLVAVGVALLMARGWRAAALHTVPLGMVYVAWWAHYRSAVITSYGRPAAVFSFARAGVVATFGALGQLSVVSWLLAVVLVLGLVLAWTDSGTRERRRRLALPTGLLVAAAVFLLMAGFGRTAFFGADYARSGRYVHVEAAMLLPAIACAANALVARWHQLLVVVLALLLIGVPGNIHKADSYRSSPAASTATSSLRHLIEAVPRTPLAREVPRSLLVDPLFAEGVTVGWLLDGVRAGRIPAPGPSTPIEMSDIDFRLSLLQREGSTNSTCHQLRRPVDVHLPKGGAVEIHAGAVMVQDLTPRNGVRSAPLVFGTTVFSLPTDHLLVAIARPMTIRIRRAVGAPATLCWAVAGGG